MTELRLHDLLHEAVSDVTAPDLVETAWRSGVRARRRRTASLAAGATAVVVAAAGAFALVARGPASQGPVTGPSTETPSTSSAAPSSDGEPAVAAPDAHYDGLPVWWSPTLAQEDQLPPYPESPLPPTIDLGAPAGALADHTVRRALAAFAATREGIPLEYVRVLTPDGRLLTVDTSPVRPMTDPEGNQRVRTGPSLLSRSGEYLMFPQDHSVLIYSVWSGRWRTIDTGNLRTWDATWIGDRTFSLPDPAEPLAQAQEYSVDGTREGSSNVIASGLPDVPLGSSQLLGRARTGRGGIAQAFTAGAPIPQPPGSGTQPAGSDWIAVTGARDGLLVIPYEDGRQKSCCQVDGWIGPGTVLYDSASSGGTRLLAWDVATGRFWQVSRLTGVALGQQTVAASYAQLPAAEAPSPR